MSSNGNGTGGGPAIALVARSTRGESRRGVGQPSPEASEVLLAHAAASLAGVEREVDHLWRHAMTTGDRALSERLVEVSHALHRAVRLMEQDHGIG
jgi:hypothetical protein